MKVSLYVRISLIYELGRMHVANRVLVYILNASKIVTGYRDIHHSTTTVL